jgi:single-strand DNA-binding protein
MNKVTISGNLGKDPELKFTQNGQSTVKMTVATSRKVKDEWVSTWHNVTAWGSLAENAASSLQKGDRVTISGRYDCREWEDKSGNKRTSYEIVADDIAASMKNASVEITRIKTESAGSNGPEEDF